MTTVILEVLACVVVAALLGFGVGWLVRTVVSRSRTRELETAFNTRFQELERVLVNTDTGLGALSSRMTTVEHTRAPSGEAHAPDERLDVLQWQYEKSKAKVDDLSLNLRKLVDDQRLSLRKAVDELASRLDKLQIATGEVNEHLGSRLAIVEAEQRKAAAANDLRAITARFNEFEHEHSNTFSESIDALSSRLIALESRQKGAATRGDIQQLEARVAGLDDERRHGDARLELRRIEQRIDAIETMLTTGVVPDVTVDKRYEVEDIEGIGKAFGRRLRNIGITTSAELLERCAMPDGIEEVARLAEMEKMLVRKCAIASDLLRVPGIEPQGAELLEACQVDSMQTLARQDASQLAENMRRLNARAKLAPGLDPNPLAVAAWVEHARSLPAKLPPP